MQAAHCQRLSLLAMQIGRNLLGMRVGDLMDAVDYLQQRPDHDSNRTSRRAIRAAARPPFFLAAMDTRIAAAIPSCYFCTWAAIHPGGAALRLQLVRPASRT